jgi:uncharacterized membrane protein YhaH (DUF805 family)
MSTVNPYQAPQATLESANATMTFDESSPFSPTGRFGRANYIVYAFGLYLVTMLFIAAAAALGGGNQYVVGGATVIGYGVMLVLGFIFMIRRLHDLNWSGWLSALSFIPIANLVIAIPVLFFRGTDGANKYGAPPKPAKSHTYITAVLLVLVFVGGIVAAIAIPAYQDYVQRASEVSQNAP